MGASRARELAPATAVGDFFVGRERELAELRGLVAAARARQGAFALVSGEAGVGKTALVRHVALEAEAQGFRVVWGRCWDRGGAPAYWPWGRIVDELCRDRDLSWFEDGMGARGRRLARIAPELGERLGVDGGREPEFAQDRFAVLDSLAGLLRAASRNGPILLALDDVDAADADALEALYFIARDVADVPVLGLATCKEQPLRARPEGRDVLAGVARATSRIRLTGLSEPELERLLECQTGAPPDPLVTRDVLERTAGNPFFARELGRMLADDPCPDHPLPLPAGVRDVIELRLDTLSAAARRLLAIASVLGLDFQVAVLEQAAGTSREELIAMLAEAEAAGLVTTGRGSAAFVHGLVRETLYCGLPALERARLHECVGETLEQAGAGLPELAHHFFEAGAGPKAADYAARAGATAVAAHAWEEGARLYRQALDGNPERAELLVELARAEVHAALPQARETLRAAVREAQAADRPDLAACAALEFGSFALSPGVVDDELVSVLRNALAGLDAGQDALRARLKARLAVALYWTPDAEARMKEADEAVSIARRLEDPATLAYALAHWQGAASSPERTESCLEAAGELFTLAESIGEFQLALPARIRQIGYLLEMGDLPGAERAMATFERIAADSHDPRALAYVPLERSRRAAIEGDFEEAERLTAEAQRMGARLQDSTIPLQSMAQVVGVRWTQGRLRELRDVISQSKEALRAMPVFRTTLALAHCEAGDLDGARRELADLAPDEFAALPRDSVWLLALAYLCEVCAHLGEAEHARTLYGLLAPYDTRNVTSPNAIFGGPVARYLGLAAAAQGEWATADRHFTAAAERARLDGARPMVMRARLDHARVLLERRAPGDIARAGDFLDEAGALAEALDAHGAAEWVSEARARLGPRPVAAESRVASMRREGGLWRFDYDGRVIHVRHTKGMHYLGLLLARPGIPIGALDLEVGAGTAGPAEDGLSVRRGTGDALPALDAAARADYKRRIDELREEIEEAERWHDGERVSRARDELEFLMRELAGAFGRGGRSRPTGASAERARQNVTRAITTARRIIEERDGELAHEFSRVRTGAACTYEPADPRRPVRWEVVL